MRFGQPQVGLNSSYAWEATPKQKSKKMGKTNWISHRWIQSGEPVNIFFWDITAFFFSFFKTKANHFLLWESLTIWTSEKHLILCHMGKWLVKLEEGNITIRIMNQKNVLPKKKFKIIIDNTKKGGSLERFCWAGCSVTTHIQHFLNNGGPTLIKLTTLEAKQGKTRSFGIIRKEIMPLRTTPMDVEWHSAGQNSRPGLKDQWQGRKVCREAPPVWLRLFYNRSGDPDGKKASTIQNISRREKKTY